MPLLQQISLTLHLLAALLWLGGMFFLAVVGAPVLRRLESAELRARLFQLLGERFRTVGWISIAVLVATGLANLHFRGVLSLDRLTDPEFWRHPFGRALSWKLTAVGAMVATSALHDFVLGPLPGRLPEGTPERERARRWSGWLARGNAAVGVVVVYWAVRLARGGW